MSTNTDNKDLTVDEQKQDAGKTEKSFNANLKKVVSILGSKDLLAPSKKVKGNVVSDIVAELTKDREEQNRQAVKTELSTLLTKYVEFETEVKKKEEEFKKLKEQKQKEFIDASNKFFNKIQEVDTFIKSMEQALLKASETQE